MELATFKFASVIIDLLTLCSLQLIQESSFFIPPLGHEHLHADYFRFKTITLSVISLSYYGRALNNQ